MRFSLQAYREVKFPHNIVSLYLNRLLLQIAFNVVGVFLVIFFFEEFGTIWAPIAVFAIVHTLYALLTPLGARLIGKVGLKRMMMLAMPFAFGAAFSLFFWDQYPLLILAAYIVLILGYKVLYWVPYHIDFAAFTTPKTRGRQITVFKSVSQLVLAMMPFIGGAIIVFFGYNSLFLLSAMFFLVAFLPLLFIRNTYETFSFSYRETFRRLVSKENRAYALAYAGDGAQSGVTAVIWPVFIFILLDGAYLSVGIISSLVIFALIALRFVVGNLVDRWSREKMLTVSAIIHTTGWVIKVFVETAFQIFIIDVYHRAGNVANRLSFETSTYDRAADNGHYIDEFTVLKEVALNGGRGLMLVVIGILVTVFDIKIAFLVAALSTLLMTFLNRRLVPEQRVPVVPIT